MAEAELRNMIMNFRVSDLQVLLGFSGRNKTGKKQELQTRSLDLLKLKSPAIEMKIRELHNRRYHHQLADRRSNYELPERTVNDRPMHHYDPQLNSYGDHRNLSARSTQIHPSSSSSYPVTKSYIPPIPYGSSTVPYNTTFKDVKFKELPFYDILCVLLCPTTLASDVSDRYQETSFTFQLTPQQAQNVSLSRTPNGNYGCQILLRFCIQDTNSEQDDNFPPSVGVKVNTKVVSLPNPIPTNRPGVEPKRPSKPVNITSVCKLSPLVRNVVTINWSSTYGRTYVAALFLARQLTSSILLQRLKTKGATPPESTTAMIIEKLQQGQDAEIATTSLRGSLICPLGKIKMELPCRATTCTHVQCFDANLYIQMNEKKPKWICPVCDKPAVFKMLSIDGLFIKIASQVPPDCTEVQFNEDGSWTAIMPVKEPKETKKAVEKHPKKSNPVEVVDIISDSDSEEIWSYNLDPNSLKLVSKSPPLASSPSSSLSLPSPPIARLTPSPLHFSRFAPPGVQIPTDTFVSTSTSYITPAYPDALHLATDSQNELPEPGCILPDLVLPNTDTSLPSTSSSSPGQNSASYPQVPFLSNPVYYPSIGSNAVDPAASTSGSQSVPTYNSFDFLSLLNIPEVEPQKLKEFEKKESIVSPDVISLD